MLLLLTLFQEGMLDFSVEISILIDEFNNNWLEKEVLLHCGWDVWVVGNAYGILFCGHEEFLMTFKRVECLFYVVNIVARE